MAIKTAILCRDCWFVSQQRYEEVHEQHIEAVEACLELWKKDKIIHFCRTINTQLMNCTCCNNPIMTTGYQVFLT